MSSIFNSIGKAANSMASAVGIRPTATAAMEEYEEMPPGYNTMTESKMNNSSATANATANANANVKKNMTNVPLESTQSGGRRSKRSSKRSKRSSKRSKRSSKRSKRSKRSSKRSSRN